MLRISICDDEKNMRLLLSSMIEKLCGEQGIEVSVNQYISAENYLAHCRASGTDGEKDSGEDLLFLDIEMESGESGTDGMKLARLIRNGERRRQPVIIFVTGHEKYVYEAFDVGAFGYLLKPVNERRFADIFLRAAGQIEQEKSRKKRVLLIEQCGGGKTIRLSDLYYAESQNHKIILHMKKENFEYYTKMKELQGELPEHFFRIHRSFLINLEYVEAYTKKEVEMINGDKLLISKYKYNDFVNAYLDFISRK